jgi:superfamily II DNA/RNA helicase
MMDFLELGVEKSWAEALEKEGIQTPMPIQTEAIPLLLGGKNAYLSAPTGTGKTLAYLLPLLQHAQADLPQAQGLVLAPTHELAAQIHQQLTQLLQATSSSLRSALLIGGANPKRQMEKLKKKPHILVGSAGRVLELARMRKLKLHALKALVLDEADRLLQREDQEVIDEIASISKKDLQWIFASATTRAGTLKVAEKRAENLILIEAGGDQINPDIQHFFFRSEARSKADLLRRLVRAIDPERAIVFVHRNKDAELVRAKMEHYGIPVADLHGAHGKMERKKALDAIRAGKVHLLIASDMAARGLDIKGVSHVFNYDLPSAAKDYLHRAGRTGRAGEEGFCISLAAPQELRLVARYASELSLEMTEAFIREGEIYALDDD